jgi:hypothetical protein
MPEVPKGVMRYATSPNGNVIERPGYGALLRVADLSQLYEAWAEGLLSEAVVEAVARTRYERLWGDSGRQWDRARSEKDRFLTEARADLQAAIQAATGEGQ